MVLEQFKQSLSKVMQTYLNDLFHNSIQDSGLLDKPSGQVKKTGKFEKRHGDCL